MASTKKQPPSDRWQYGVPPVGNANFAWVQHFLYHLAPRGKGGIDPYADVPGFCKSASLEEIRKHGHVLTPGRYVGAEPQEDDGVPFAEKMAQLTAQWREQQAEARRLDAAIADNLKSLGFWSSVPIRSTT